MFPMVLRFRHLSDPEGLKKKKSLAKRKKSARYGFGFEAISSNLVPARGCEELFEPMHSQTLELQIHAAPFRPLGVQVAFGKEKESQKKN